jgi:hypothetical protein
MGWRFLVAQKLAMIFLAMIVLGLRDMLRIRSDTALVRSHQLFLLIVAALLAWSIWLLFREARLLAP